MSACPEISATQSEALTVDSLISLFHIHAAMIEHAQVFCPPGFVKVIESSGNSLQNIATWLMRRYFDQTDIDMRLCIIEHISAAASLLRRSDMSHFAETEALAIASGGDCRPNQAVRAMALTDTDASEPLPTTAIACMADLCAIIAGNRAGITAVSHAAINHAFDIIARNAIHSADTAALMEISRNIPSCWHTLRDSMTLMLAVAETLKKCDKLPHEQRYGMTQYLETKISISNFNAA